MRSITSILISLLLIYSTVSLSQIRTQPVVLKGNVLDHESGFPLNKAIVRVINVDSNLVVISTATNSKGEFTLDPKRLRIFKIEVERDSYEKYTSDLFSIKDILMSRQYNLPNILLKRKVLLPDQTKPKDDQFKLPKEKTPDTTSAKTLVKKRFTEQRIYPSPDAFKLIYALNPSLDTTKPIPDNYPLRLPKFPKLNRAEKKQFRKDYKLALKPSKTETNDFLNGTTNLNGLMNRLNSGGIKMNTNVSAKDFEQLKESLTVLQKDMSDYKPKAHKTSKSTMSLMNREISLLNQLLQNTVSSGMLNEKTYSTCQSLINSLEHFILIIIKKETTSISDKTNCNYVNVYKVHSQTYQSPNSRPELNISISSLQLLRNYFDLNNQMTVYRGTFFSDPADPRPFNIYVFVDDPKTKMAKDVPEKKRFDIKYFPPGLENLRETPGNLPASTANASIGPAKFDFLIEDRDDRKITVEKSIDAEILKDDYISWNFFQKIFKKRPYKLCIYLQNVY